MASDAKVSSLGSGRRLATRVDGALYYVHSDLLGSTVAVSNDTGQPMGWVQYDPYGEVITSTLPTDLTDRLFTGQRLDSSTGLYYYNARYYDPHLGRFIQPDTLVPDPLNPQAWNRFSYCYNNPATYIDPMGHQGTPWWARALGKAATALQSIADPERNPRTAAYHYAMWGGIEAWGDVIGMYGQTIDYTSAAISEGRWEDASRGMWALAQENWELAKTGGKAGVIFVWGAVTTPVRIFTTDIPEFYAAGSERLQGKGREWDVIWTATLLAGDVSAVYGMYRMISGPRSTKGIDTSKFTSGQPTRAGGIRNRTAFWKEWMSKYPDTLSQTNRTIIESRLAPVVDDIWVQHFPEHAPYMGEILVHHHLNYGPIAIPLPQTVHSQQPGWGIWHP